jgi:hypothetical protein
VQLLSQTKNAVSYFMSNCELDEHPGVKERVTTYRVHQIARD